MANCGYMTIKSDKQGFMSNGCCTPDSLGGKDQSGHADQIMVLAFTHNMANLDNALHATHQPVYITKHVDKSTPLLSQALANREQVDCVIDFYRTRAPGIQEKFYTIEISGGLIRELTQDMPHALLQNDGQPQEHLAISYRDIKWTHHAGSTNGNASWAAEQ